METEDISKPKAIYLITTKYNNKLFESYKESDNCKHCTDKTFLKEILLLEGGFFRSLWSFMSINNKLNPELPLIKYIKGRLEKKTNFAGILEWWSYPQSESDAMNEIADLALGIIPNLSDSDKKTYKQLLTGFIRIELDDVILLITHNWYKSGLFNSLRCKDATRYIFLENLIKIAAKTEGINPTEIKLFLHDKDIIESGDKDEPLRDKIPDTYSKTCPNLHNAITKGNVRVFMHDSNRAHPNFFKNVLNQGEPICQTILEGYFNDRIPPKISIIPEKCIVIDITQIENKYSCSTTEIINAIAEYQLTNEFKLSAVELNDVYKDALSKIQKKELQLPILVKGNKSLGNLQREDGRALYLDSSIWIRYAQIGDMQDENTVQTIEDFFVECQGLYKTANAKEVKEFRARLVKNSFLESFSGGHYGDVTPFVFHSETEMNGLIYSGKTNDNKEIIDGSSLKTKLSQYSEKAKSSKLDWRLLIVDDNAYQESTSPIESKVQKCDVIANILKDDFYLKCEDSEKDSPKCILCKGRIEKFNAIAKNDKQCFTINLECATDIKGAIAKLKKRRFDLILLDYLLGENKDKNSRDYGTDLLRDLKRQYEDNILIRKQLFKDELADLEEYIQVKGPFGKLWIFFISAFSNAISEQMLSDGMHYDTDYWNIARGACPITTPELFRYNLLSLMDRQFKYITEIGGDDKKYNMTTLVDFLVFLFEEPENVRMRTLKYFNSLLRLRARYDLLKNDYYMGGKENPEALKNGSPLVQSLFSDMDCYSNAFWEHIQHLIYLIAYGNILQWDEMWDEYIFVKENLKRADTHTGDKSICKKIEDYIIGIKSANFK